MHFDADAAMHVLTKPRFVSGGREYVGVILSADEWFALLPKIDAAQRESATPADVRALVLEMTDAMFPRPRWQFWRVRVSTLVARLPWAAQLEALTSFTVAQALAQTPGRNPPKTSGTDSPA